MECRKAEAIGIARFARIAIHISSIAIQKAASCVKNNGCKMVRTRGTGGEKKLRSILLEADYSIQANKKFPPFEVDVYVHDVHAGVEFDGKGWHGFKKRDRQRDEQILEDYDLPIFRLSDFEDETIDSLFQFLEEQSSTTRERKQRYEETAFERGF